MSLPLNRETLIDAGDVSASIASDPMRAPDGDAAIEVTTTGSPVGTLEIQGSISEINWGPLPFTDVAAGIVSTSIRISTAKTFLIDVERITLLRLLRAVWTADAGSSGTITVLLSEEA